jgi:hypothetical protein
MYFGYNLHQVHSKPNDCNNLHQVHSKSTDCNNLQYKPNIFLRDVGYYNLLALSVPDVGYYNPLALSVPDVGYYNHLALSTSGTLKAK